MKIYLFFIISLISFYLKAQDQTNVKKPNIIFILSDDHATDAISAYSDRFAELSPTPNIDRIANEGAIINNAFSTNAICGPSRASIITGKYSHVNNYYKNYKGGYFDGNQWTFPKALQDSGYQTALVGKWHLASEPQGFNYYKYHIAKGEQGLYWDPVYNDNGKTVQEQGYATNITTDFALDWLKNSDKNQPFCLLLQYKAPHREWSPDTKYEDLWSDRDIDYPDTFFDNYKGREKTAGDTHMTMDFFNRRDMKMTPPDSLSGKALRQWLDYGNKPSEIVSMGNGLDKNTRAKLKYQRYIKDYLATIKSVDDNIGRVLDYLSENGLEDNTIIVYASDQGFFLGDHGWFDKRFMYEESLRMPFVVRYPEKIKAKTSINDVISNIDIAPTILDMAGIKPPEEVQGKSFFKQLKGGENDQWRQSMYYHYYEYPFWHRVQPHYGIRTERYKLIHFYYKMDAWELYDLEKDPNEMTNLINDPSYKKIVSKLKQDLNDLKTQYGNNLSLEELRQISDTDFGGLESKKKKSSN